MADKSRPDLAPRRPSSNADLPPAADDWVREGTEATAQSAPAPAVAGTAAASAKEATKRLTIDVPASLHHAIMVQARASGRTAKDEITPLLRSHYADALRRYPLP